MLIRPTSALAVLLVCSMLPATPARAQAPDGEAVFQATCATCHANPAAGSRAPGRDALAEVAPESILISLTTGTMFQQGAKLSMEEKRAVAAFIAGRPIGTPGPPSTIGRCTTAAPPLVRASLDTGWNGWGANAENTRFVPAARAGLLPQDVPRLRLKWAFGFAGVSSARGQPAVLGARLFVGSESGDVFALDARTGCTHWTFHAQAGVRTAITVAPYTTAGGDTRFAVYTADVSATAYAIDAETGQEIWSRRVDDHPYAKSTGAVAVHAGRVYVPTTGVGEEGQGGGAHYPCCTFRGSVTSLDANTGAVVWKTYVIPQAPQPRGTSRDGAQLWGPSGAGIWAAPTVDARRRAVYVSTGNGYAEPQVGTTDAVIALDMDSGAIRWVVQPLAGDVFAGGCSAADPDNPNCPKTLGPDLDFSASPMIVPRGDGRDLLIIQQKSGIAYAFDPDREGALVWEYRTSAGGGLGGEWGSASDGSLVYFSANGTAGPNPGGVRAARVATGQEVWSRDAEPRLCGTERGCSAAQGAAVTAIPGVVFAGSMDGGIRAYASDDGRIVWRFDTNRAFETVNGVQAKGGAMDGPGAVVAGGMVYVNSGYVSIIGRPGNVLLAFGVD
jgi:polyvinyl alcohol dehydrogenase (cytochrome)